MRRVQAMAVSLSGLALSTATLFLYPNPLLAYLGMGFLALSGMIYLLPEEHPGRWIQFPREHSFFRFLKLVNLAFLPLTFLFVLGGLWSVWTHAYWLLLVLTAMRIVPGVVLDETVQRRRKALMAQTPEVEAFSHIGKAPLCKARGYVFEMRTRRKRFSSVLYNVWLTDGSPTRLFIPSMTHIRGVTEPIREGAKASVVGPSTSDFGITAIQPLASAVPPAGWTGSDNAWLDVVWRRCRKRRAGSALVGSAVYLVAVAVLSWIVGSLAGYASAFGIMIFLSLLSAVFFTLLSEKAQHEGAFYEVKDYFEPKRRHPSPEKWEEKIRSLKGLVESGRISEDYVSIIEKKEGKYD